MEKGKRKWKWKMENGKWKMENKIWKIENIGTSSINSGNARVELNSRRTNMWNTSTFPIWLGSGNYLQFIHTGGGTCWAYLSIIQFTLN